MPVTAGKQSSYKGSPIRRKNVAVKRETLLKDDAEKTEDTVMITKTTKTTIIQIMMWNQVEGIVS